MDFMEGKMDRGAKIFLSNIHSKKKFKEV